MFPISEFSLFKEEYHKWEKLYLNEPKFKYFAEESLNDANEKFNDIARSDSHFNNLVKYPVIIVNLYTQEVPKIYGKVNSQLGKGTVEEIWKRYTNLLVKAIDILSPLVNKDCQRYTVYRGQGCYPIADVKQNYTFGRFLSTTFNPEVAFEFVESLDCSTIIKIENATGLPVYMFSAFPTEEEVIIKYNAVMHVKAKFNDSEKNNAIIREMIQAEVPKLLKSNSTDDFKTPDVLVYLEMLHGTDIHKFIVKRSFDKGTRATFMDTLLDEDDKWKEHLKAEYDGVDSQWVPPCIDVSHITSGMANTRPSEFPFILLVFAALCI